MSGLEALAVHKSYAETPALRGVSFEVAVGEVVAVLGPSGCGKSTLLAVIAGLEAPDQGEVRWDGHSLEGVPPHRRNFGLMFQDYALFPHMNVFDNVAFGLRMDGRPPERVDARVEEVLELVGLAALARRDISTLSGGESQRTALARSLAPEPRLLMLDEPLGSLDRTLRERLMLELRAILSRVGQTAIYVTHDQEEAFAIADRVVLLNEGRVAQIGTPEELYLSPASPFAARFLGLTNLLEARVEKVDGRWTAETQIGRLPLAEAAPGPALILLRPDAVRPGVHPPFHLAGTLTGCSFRGALYRAVVEINGAALRFDFPPGTALPQAGSQIWLSFDPQEALHVFPAESQG
jgi:ABC-type Fe3+/spermidine/putrescine transport system ATPase subunit